MIINKPTKISICFIGGDLDITSNQERNLYKLKDSYLVEFLHRGHKFQGQYISFSQVVNEFVVESTSEFLVFINPKVNPECYQVEDLIQKLCSGFCWVSRINFGFWATTKELFRNIGLMDERFIGGEYEDNDFMLRLKEFGKAIYWQYKVDEYPFYEMFSISGNRGLSQTAFLDKWIEKENDVFIDKDTEEKKLPLSIRLDRRYDIYNSWMNLDKSVFIDDNKFFSGSKQFNKTINRVKINKTLNYSESQIKIKCSEDKNLFLEFLCQSQTQVLFIFINRKDQKLSCRQKMISSNMWCSDSLFESSEYEIELKVFHEGDKIYHNKFMKIPFDLDIKVGLKLTEKKLE